MLEQSLDYSLPLAALLKVATKDTHERAQASLGGRLLVTGHISKELYTQYLMLLWHVYDAFERALEQHTSHPVLKPTYNPPLLARAPALSNDIAYFLQVSPTSWQTHPLHLELMSRLESLPINPLRAYVSRINSLASSPDPVPLLAHSYVRYLGDLSGGQYIAKDIAKSYDLDEEAGCGIEFYLFDHMGRRVTGEAEMERIKDWFRERMNEGSEAGRDEEEVRKIKAAVVREANLVFELNIALLSLFEDERVARPLL